MGQTTKTFKQFLAESYDTNYSHSSTQVNLPEELAQRILEWSDDEIPDSFIATNPDDPSFGREDQPHVTVLYRLRTVDSRPVEQALQGQKSGDIVLGKMSLFTSNDKFDVLKIGVESEVLHKLHKTLRSNLETTDSYPSYVPHVTIAYMKKGKGDKFVGDETFDGETFKVTEVVFYSKTGQQTKIKIGGK